MNEPTEDPVLKTARREALAVFVTWVCAFAYTVTYCTLYGYGRSADDLRFVHLFAGIAFPDWVFWGIIAPWSVCFFISWWFSYAFMTDADLGEELEESDEFLGNSESGQGAGESAGGGEETHD